MEWSRLVVCVWCVRMLGGTEGVVGGGGRMGGGCVSSVGHILCTHTHTRTHTQTNSTPANILWAHA